MLGLRGSAPRPVIQHPFQMQTQAIMEALAIVATKGAAVTAEIMVPLVGSVNELALIRQEIDYAVPRPGSPAPCTSHKVGTMIELPRAAVTAREIATWPTSSPSAPMTRPRWSGASADDVESSFFSEYLEKASSRPHPETIDRDGVGRWCASLPGRAGDQARPEARSAVSTAVTRSRSTSSTSQGLDYVSCSPFQVPVARLEAGRAQAMESQGNAG